MGSLPHRDYDVRVSGRPFRLRVREGPNGSIIVEADGSSFGARRSGDAIEVEADGKTYRVSIIELEGGRRLRACIGGKSFDVEVGPIRPVSLGPAPRTAPGRPSPRAGAPAPARARALRGTISSPMPGKVVALKVKPGDGVSKGDVLVVVEAMKMGNEIKAPRDGVVREVFVSEGSLVSAGQPLLTLD